MEDENDIWEIPARKPFWTRSKIIVLWISLILFIAVSAFTHLDKKVAAAIVILYGLITPVFSGIFSFISQYVTMIPFIGPNIIKVFTLPATALISLSAYIVTLVRIKQGQIRQVVNAKVYAISMTIGIIIGYILGKIF